MDITVTRNSGIVPMTTIQLHGKLDGNNYMEFFDAAERLYRQGERNLVLDLSDLSYMSSAGIVALHKVARLFNGMEDIVKEEGWAAYRAVARGFDDQPQVHVKLVGLNSQVRDVLDLIGFSGYFEIYEDLPQAVAAFQYPDSQDTTSDVGY